MVRRRPFARDDKGICTRCNRLKIMRNIKKIITRGDAITLQGNCSRCGSMISRIIGRKNNLGGLK